MTKMTRLEQLVKELPTELHREAEAFLEFLIATRSPKRKATRQTKSSPKQPLSDPLLKNIGKSESLYKAQSIAMARCDLLRLYRQAASHAPERKKTAVKKKFVSDYNLGYYPQIYATLGITSYSSVERWNRELRKTGDPYDLAPQYGKHRKGKTKVTPEQQRCLLFADPPPHDRPVGEVVRAARENMKTQGVKDNCHVSTYRRFMKEIRLSHFDT